VQRPPGATVAREELVSRGRAVAASGIVWKRGRRIFCPKIQDWLNSGPARLDVIGALEQGRVTDHAIVDQGFIAGVRRGLEIVLVGEVHGDVAQLHGRAGTLSRKL